jgi:hypothetical protein
VSEPAVNTLLGAPADMQDDTAGVTGGSADTRATDSAGSLRSRPSGDDDAGADPTLEGIPREVIENIGAYDTDSAGGCG